MTRLLQQAAGYVGASALAFVADISILALLVSELEVPYLPAAAISFTAGTVVVYWLSIRHVFDYRRLADWRREFSIFAALGLVGLAVNLAAMFVLVSGVGMHFLLGKVGAASCTFAVNFLLRRWALFTPRTAELHGQIDQNGAPL